MNKISWYLKLDINNLRTLFSDIPLNYNVECLICNCGHNKTYITKELLDIDDIYCENCDNTLFFSANDFFGNSQWYDSIQCFLDEDFLKSLNPKVSYDLEEKKLKSKVGIKVPKSIDLASNKVIYEYKNIFEFNIDKDGEIDQKILANFDLKANFSSIDLFLNAEKSEADLVNKNELLSSYKKKILIEFKKHSKRHESKILNNVDTLEDYSFFIKNKHLLEVDFTKWKNIQLLNRKIDWSINDALDFIMNYRKEKSLKKMVFKDYEKQILKYDKYNPIMVYILVRIIKDVNILNRTIKINLNKHIKEIDNYNDMYRFLKYLSSKFSAKQLEKLLLEYSLKEEFYFAHSVMLFSDVKEYLNELNLTKCKYKIIHDDLASFHRFITKRHLYKRKIDYIPIERKPCIKVENYEVKLPKDGKDLFTWANKLENCLSGYFHSISKKETIVYGFFEKGEIKFAVEITNNNIIQSKLKYNEDLGMEDTEVLLNWHKTFFETSNLK